VNFFFQTKKSADFRFSRIFDFTWPDLKISLFQKKTTCLYKLEREDKKYVSDENDFYDILSAIQSLGEEDATAPPHRVLRACLNRVKISCRFTGY